MYSWHRCPTTGPMGSEILTRRHQIDGTTNVAQRKVLAPVLRRPFRPSRFPGFPSHTTLRARHILSAEYPSVRRAQVGN